MVKNLLANVGDIRDMSSISGWARSSAAGHTNALQYPSLENPWTEEPGRLQYILSQRVGHDRSNLALALKSFLKDWRK